MKPWHRYKHFRPDKAMQRPKALSFTATTATTTLRFLDTSLDTIGVDALLDNVAVVAVPEPSPLVLAAIGILGAVLLAHRRRFGTSLAGFLGVMTLVFMLPTFGSAGVFSQSDLNSTSQILNNTPGAVGVNFIYPDVQSGVESPGTVNGIAFQDVDWMGGMQLLSNGMTITPINPDSSPDFPSGSVRSRFQDTSSTITGPSPDAVVLQSIANTINYVTIGEQLELRLTGLNSNQAATIQLIGGDSGSFLGNWLGSFDISANGVPVGTWYAANDGDNTQATLVTFTAAADGLGQLDLVLLEANNVVVVNGAFAALGGMVITVPEPSTFGLAAIGILGLAAASKRRSTWRRLLVEPLEGPAAADGRDRRHARRHGEPWRRRDVAPRGDCRHQSGRRRGHDRVCPVAHQRRPGHDHAHAGSS